MHYYAMATTAVDRRRLGDEALSLQAGRKVGHERRVPLRQSKEAVRRQSVGLRSWPDDHISKTGTACPAVGGGMKSVNDIIRLICSPCHVAAGT